MNEFLASTLTSRQLLALLFLCENQRKGNEISLEMIKGERPKEWEELLGVFAGRLGNLSEEMRHEVLGAHLMSVEDIDIYHNETLESLLMNKGILLNLLAHSLDADPRFGSNA